MLISSYMKVIFCNDDFGISYGFTESIKECFLNGITTSTAICVNGNAYNYAVQLLKSELKKINLGLHLNLDYGRSTTKELQNEDGKYKFTFLKYFIFLRLGNKSLLKSLEKDLNYQFKKVFLDNLNITFVNGHDHIYMIPPIFEIVCKLCKKYKVKYIRLPREPFYSTGVNDLKTIFSSNMIKFLLLNYFSRINYKVLKKHHLRTTDSFYGVLYTQKMSTLTVMTALKDALRRDYNSIEILGHPSYINDLRDKKYETKVYEKFAKSRKRLIEKQAFLSKSIKEFINEEKIQIVPFNKI